MPKKGNCYSGRGLAKECGINEKTIRIAEKEKRLVKVVKGTYKGKYDITDPTNVEGIKAIKANTQSGSTKSSPKKKTTKKKKQAVEIPVSLDMADLNDLRIQKEREIIREKQLKNEKLRGDLVDRKAVSKVFNKLWSVDSNQLIPLATKLAPEIASICGVEDPEVITKVREKIDKEIWGVLGHCKRIMSDYLAEIEAENLKEIENENNTKK
jgi:hypothetical protein